MCLHQVVEVEVQDLGEAKKHQSNHRHNLSTVVNVLHEQLRIRQQASSNKAKLPCSSRNHKQLLELKRGARDQGVEL